MIGQRKAGEVPKPDELRRMKTAWNARKDDPAITDRALCKRFRCSNQYLRRWASGETKDS